MTPETQVIGIGDGGIGLKEESENQFPNIRFISDKVESAHRSVPQKRLKLPGAFRHPDSINPMLSLRVLRANGWWDDFWKKRTRMKIAA